ncbi:hypothetical protein [Streptomyces cyaneofuscatus]|uniref:hypothetical protein n=1 Tax=Streptomyces cyaneofuscatus TaxID=66883 RepID=UPI0036EC32CD
MNTGLRIAAFIAAVAAVFAIAFGVGRVAGSAREPTPGPSTHQPSTHQPSTHQPSTHQPSVHQEESHGEGAP